MHKPPGNAFAYRRRVNFHETDLAGIVHFSWYFRYIEEAEHALWRAAGLSIDRPGSDIGWPRVSASFDFRNPLRFEEEFDVLVTIDTATRRTLQYSFTVVRGETVIGRGRMTSVCVRKLGDGTMHAMTTPPEIVERLRATAGGAAQADASGQGEA